MAKDSQANYAKIGFFIIMGALLIVGTLVYLGGFGAKKHEFIAETHFANSVSGLDVGSRVALRGVKVGSVRRLSFVGAEYDDVRVPSDRHRIYVELALDTRLMSFGDDGRAKDVLRRLVERGLHATVTASGVTGLSYIELNFPKNVVADEKVSWKPRHPMIPPAPSILQSAADSMTQLLDQLNRMDIAGVWSNVARITESVGGLVDEASGLLSSQRGNVEAILGNVRDASAGLGEFAEEIRRNPSAILRERTPERLDETR